MKFKRTLSLIIAVIMIAATFGVIAIPAAAAVNAIEPSETASVWDGTSVDTDWYTNNKSATEYTLTTAAQLAGLAKLVNDGTQLFQGKTVKLGADIVWNEGTFTMDSEGAVSITEPLSRPRPTTSGRLSVRLFQMKITLRLSPS